MAPKHNITHSTRTSNLADVLERVLDKGVVIAGDIKIKLVDIELLTIQIRLVVCSVERALEMGMDWWRTDPNLCQLARTAPAALPAGAGGQMLDAPTELLPFARAIPPLAESPAMAAPLSASAEARIAELEQLVHRLERQITAPPA